jgi:nucleoside-diphosphate-sugar epimerase
VKIITTSKSGLIGSNVKFDAAISRENCDFSNFQSCKNALDELNPSAVVHFAGKLQPSQKEPFKDNLGLLVNNAQIDLNIISACVSLEIKNLLSISSVSAYGEDASLPYKEAEVLLGRPNINYYGYSSSKRLTLELTRSAQLDTGWNYKSILLGNIYGPFEKFDLKGTIVGKTIFMIDACIRNSEDLHLWGDGKELRSLTYVKDLKELMSAVLTDINSPDEMNVGNGELISIHDLVHLIARLMDFSGKIVFDGNISTSPTTSKFADFKEFNSRYPQFQFTRLEEGLIDTIQWFRHAELRHL